MSGQPIFWLADISVMRPEQMVGYPLALESWIDNGATVSSGFTDPAGGTAARRLTAGPVTNISNGRSIQITLAHDGEATVTVTMKPDTTTSAGVLVYTVEGAVYNGMIQVIWTDGVPTVTWDDSNSTNPGTIFAPVNVGGGWFEISFSVKNLVAANDNRVYVYPDRATGLLACYYYAANAWNAPLSMPRQTTSGFATYTLRVANRGFAMADIETTFPAWPTETSANMANLSWDERLLQPAAMTRDAWGGGRTSGVSRSSYGDLVLANHDGALDWLLYCGVDGRSASLRRGAPPYAPPPANTGLAPYFSTVLTATMEGVEVTHERVTIKLRDRVILDNTPLQATKYAGDNALPDGLEGVADDLKGKPKPVCFGKVRNVPAPCVNTSKLIYQVNDGPIFALNAVYDRGVVLGGRELVAQTLSTSFAGKPVRWATEGADGTLVIAGGDPPGAGNLARIDYSTDDGATWQASDVSGLSVNQNVQGVAYGTAIYVAQCGVTNLWTSTTPAGPWTARDVSADVSAGHTPLGVMYLNGLFCAWWGTAGGAVAGRLLTSPDGITWTARTFTGFTGAGNYCYHIGYGAGVYVAVGASGRVSYATDVSAWTSLAAVGSQHLKRIGYDGAWFIAVGDGGAVVRSRDGVAWEESVNAPLGANNLQALANGGGRWLAGGANGANIIHSADGYNWYSLANVFGTSNMNYGLWAKSAAMFLLMGDAGKLYAQNGAVEEYASLAEVSDDTLAPPPGTVKSYAPSGYFRLGATPAGEITADVEQRPTFGVTQLLPDPEDFSAASWSKTNVTLTAAVTDAFGGSAAFTYTDSVSLTGSILSRSTTCTINTTYVQTLYARKDDGTGLRFGFWRTTSDTGQHIAFVSWDDDGRPTASRNAGSRGDIMVPHDVGDGWWRFGITYTPDQTGTHHARIMIGASSAEIGSVDIFGCNVYQATGPVPYIGPSASPTTEMRVGSLIASVLLKGGVNRATWAAGDCSRLDNDATAEVGFWTDEERTLSGLLDEIGAGMTGWWGSDRFGLLRFRQLAVPAGTSMADFVASDLLGAPQRILPYDQRVPPYRLLLRWGRVYAVQTDLAGAATQTRRALVEREWREALVTDTAVQAQYLLAPEMVMDTFIYGEADAAAEATRVHALRKQQRDVVRITVPLDDETVLLDVNEVVTLTYARYGWDAGRLFRIVGVEPDIVRGRITLTVWG